MSSAFLPAGQLTVGANYWASHAGPFMWRDWCAETVERDFDRIAAAGLQVLRVFPLWPDFQPIHCLRRDNGIPVEVRHGEEPLPGSPIGQSGLSEVMLERFGTMADLAYARGLELIVGLITGWMSGRLFVPPALEGLNPITDPVSLVWQARMATAFVAHFKEHPAIRAWDLGNECNVMGPATREQAWLWAATIANAVRRADSSRPVISGMHSLGVDPMQTWTIRDQAEITDILTTHPYPLFTPHCNREPMNTMRPLLHATAETCLYADLSDRSAFVEEMGNFGPAFCGDSVATGSVRASLFSIWAHDCRAALWWCAHDQLALRAAPHDWISMERELGLIREDGAGKPVLEEIRAVRDAIEALPISSLPPRRIDAVCILSGGQDQWGVAYSAFLLAKQAGFDLKFHYGDRPLPDAELYLLPSVKGLSALSRRREEELRQKVEAGATAYFSMGDGFLNELMKMTGLEVQSRYQRAEPCAFQLEGKDASDWLTVSSAIQFDFKVRSAVVLAREGNGRPAFTMAPWGKGRFYFLAVPLEAEIAKQAGAFLPDGRPQFWSLYREIALGARLRRCVSKTSPWLGVTEHPASDKGIIVVLMNYTPAPLADTLIFAKEYVFSGNWLGPVPENTSGGWRVELPPLQPAVWHFKRIHD